MLGRRSFPFGKRLLLVLGSVYQIDCMGALTFGPFTHFSRGPAIEKKRAFHTLEGLFGDPQKDLTAQSHAENRSCLVYVGCGHLPGCQ